MAVFVPRYSSRRRRFSLAGFRLRRWISLAELLPLSQSDPSLSPLSQSDPSPSPLSPSSDSSLRGKGNRMSTPRWRSLPLPPPPLSVTDEQICTISSSHAHLSCSAAPLLTASGVDLLHSTAASSSRKAAKMAEDATVAKMATIGTTVAAEGATVVAEKCVMVVGIDNQFSWLF